MKIDLSEYIELEKNITTSLISRFKHDNPGKQYYAAALKTDVSKAITKRIELLSTTDPTLHRVLKLQRKYVMVSDQVELVEQINRTFGSVRSNGTYTLAEIGQVLGITRERVRQIEASAMKKLKHPKVGRVARELEYDLVLEPKEAWER